MESRAEMIGRIESFEFDSLPAGSTFVLNPALSEKVRPVTGQFEPFFGSTVAYYLDPDSLGMVRRLTDVLHRRHGGALAERLPLEQAHVTLHDLRASTRFDDVVDNVVHDEPAVVVALREAHAIGTIEVECTAVFNLVNMSIAIGLQPTSDNDHERLGRARSLFDVVVPSGSFTPHITLAYYRPESAQPIDVNQLRIDLDGWTGSIRGTRVALDPSRLHLLQFDSMANYWPGRDQ